MSRRGRPRTNDVAEPTLWDRTDESGQKTTDFIFTMDKQGRQSTHALDASLPQLPSAAESSQAPNLSGPLPTPLADDYTSVDFEENWVDALPDADDDLRERDAVEEESDLDDVPQKDTGKRKKRGTVSTTFNRARNVLIILSRTTPWQIGAHG